MKAKKLTDQAIKRIKPPETGRDEHFDTEVRGLALRVTSNNARSWVFMYRVEGVKNRRVYTIGKYPTVSLKDARKEARDARAKVDRGRDPALEKKRAREAEATARRDTYEAVVEEYVEKHQQRKGNRSIRETQRVLTKYPARWKKWPVKAITKREVGALLDEVYSDNGKHMAALLYRNLTTFFNWCVGRDIIEVPPIHKSMRPEVTVARNRPLSDNELKAVWNAAEQMDYPYGRLVQLLMLTGQRLNEVARMTWNEVDIDAREWYLPAERTKANRAHTVPLTDLMIEVLKGLPRFEGEYVFTVNGGRAPFRGFSEPRKKLKEKAGFEDWKVKDLRETVATVMRRDLGVYEEIIGMCLNHAPATVTTKHYAGQHDMKAKRIAFDKWDRHVARLIGRKVANVVDLTQA